MLFMPQAWTKCYSQYSFPYLINEHRDTESCMLKNDKIQVTDTTLKLLKDEKQIPHVLKPLYIWGFIYYKSQH